MDVRNASKEQASITVQKHDKRDVNPKPVRRFRASFIWIKGTIRQEDIVLPNINVYTEQILLRVKSRTDPAQ